jgi:hypothetical protein
MREGVIIITTEVRVSAIRFIEDELWLGFVDGIVEKIKDSIPCSRGVCDAELLNASYKFKSRLSQFQADNQRVGVFKKRASQKKKKKTKPTTRRATLYKKT